MDPINGLKGLNGNELKVIRLSENQELVILISLAAEGNPGDQNVALLPIKNNPVVTDPEAVNFSFFTFDGIGKMEGISSGNTVFYFLNNSLLDRNGELSKLAISLPGETVADHLIPNLFLIVLEETLPDFLDSSISSQNSGVEYSINSVNSSHASLSNIMASICPFLSTNRTTPWRGNGNRDAFGGSNKITFSSANSFNNDGTICSPPDATRITHAEKGVNAPVGRQINLKLISFDTRQVMEGEFPTIETLLAKLDKKEPVTVDEVRRAGVAVARVLINNAIAKGEIRQMLETLSPPKKENTAESLWQAVQQIKNPKSLSDKEIKAGPYTIFIFMTDPKSFTFEIQGVSIKECTKPLGQLPDNYIDSEANYMCAEVLEKGVELIPPDKKDENDFLDFTYGERIFDPNDENVSYEWTKTFTIERGIRKRFYKLSDLNLRQIVKALFEEIERVNNA